MRERFFTFGEIVIVNESCCRGAVELGARCEEPRRVGYFHVLAVCEMDEREGIMSSRYSLWRASTLADVLWPVRLGFT